MAPKRYTKNSAVERVADRFGGYGPFSKILGLAGPSTISKWNHKGGGNIPSRYHARILAMAKKKRIRVRPGDLVNV